MSGVRSLLFPRSLAVVGASPRNVAAVETVVASGVRAWGVNPNHEEVAGLRCYPSIAELPEVPECAFLMVSHERVEGAFEDAAAAGVRAFVVPGVGAEAGDAARPTTERLARRARELGASHSRAELHGPRRPGRLGRVERAPTRHDGARPRCGPLPVGLDRRRLPLARRSHRAPLRRLVGRGGGHRRCGLPRVLRRGPGYASGRSLSRDRETSRRLRRRASTVCRGGEAGGLPQGGALGRRGPRGPYAHGSARRLRARVLGRAASLLGDRSRRLPRARRDARDPWPPALAGWERHRGDLRVGR